MKIEDFDSDLIGTELEVLNDEGGIEKTINVSKVSNTSHGLIIFDDYGNPYHEDEINWHYNVSETYLLYEAIYKEYPNITWNNDKIKRVLKEFMNNMIRAGYIEENHSETNINKNNMQL